MTAQALTCQFAFWECGKCDSEALLQAVRFWDVEDAIAKRDLGITFWNTRSAISVKIKEILEGMKR